MRSAMTVLCGTMLAMGAVAAQENEAAAKAKAKEAAAKRRTEMREIYQQLKPLMAKAVEGDEELQKLQEDLKTTRREAFREQGKLYWEAMQIAAQQHPDLMESVQLIKELQKAARELQKVKGEDAEGAREEYRKTQKEIAGLRKTLDPQVKKVIAGDEEMKARVAELKTKMQAVAQMQKDLGEKLSAKVAAMSPEAKALIDRRNALFQQRRKGQGGMSQAEIQKRKKQYAQIRTRLKELDKELGDLRRKAFNAPEVREAYAAAAELAYKKMAELDPEKADLIQERQKLDQQMREMWTRRAGKPKAKAKKQVPAE